jgi:hypothetical protein
MGSAIGNRQDLRVLHGLGHVRNRQDQRFDEPHRWVDRPAKSLLRLGSDQRWGLEMGTREEEKKREEKEEEMGKKTGMTVKASEGENEKRKKMKKIKIIK